MVEGKALPAENSWAVLTEEGCGQSVAAVGEGREVLASAWG